MPITSRAAWAGKSIYEILIERLTRLEAILVAQGFSSPIARIRFHLEILCHLQRAPAIESDEVLWSLIEATELSDIYCSLPVMSPRTFREKFKAILNGPINPQQETTDSSLARNTLFELTVSGWLTYKGIPTKISHNPDVSCTVSDRRIFIQCKRPFSRRSTIANVKRACKQLSVDLNNASDPRSRGVVAISLSHAVNPHNAHMRVRTEEQMNPAIAKEIRSIADHLLLPLIKGRRIVGLACYVTTPVFIEDINQYRMGQVTALYPSRDASEADRRMLQRAFLRS